MELADGWVDELVQAAVGAHRRMWESATRLTDAGCRGPSLLPGWSRGHVLAHWARNADGQSRMLAAAARGKVAAQYPGGDAQREVEIENGAARPARQILDDAHAAVTRVEDVWWRMPPEAWLRPTVARSGTRPAWMSVWARWRETEIHHVDLDAGYTPGQWPAEFTGLLLPRVLPTLQARLADQITVQAEATDGDLAATASAAGAASDPVLAARPPHRRGRPGRHPRRPALPDPAPTPLGMTVPHQRVNLHTVSADRFTRSWKHEARGGGYQTQPSRQSQVSSASMSRGTASSYT
jgi:maleylpyruvate isomerase